MIQNARQYNSCTGDGGLLGVTVTRGEMIDSAGGKRLEARAGQCAERDGAER